MLNKNTSDGDSVQIREYLGMFDLAKGFFVIMIIFGHAITDHFNYWVFDVKKSPIIGVIVLFTIFVMQNVIPAFFIMSGYTFRRKSMNTCVKRQLHYFLKPYIYVAVSVTLITVLKKIIISGDIIEGIKYQSLPFLFGLCPGKKEFLGIYMADIGPIWFILVFVLSNILLNAVLYESKFWVQIILILALSASGLLLKDVSLPFCIQQTMICCGYLYVGMIMKKYKFFHQKLPKSFIVASSIICLFAMIFGEIAVAGNRWKLNMFDLLASYIAGTFLVWLFLKLNEKNGKIFDKIRWIGRHVLWFCCIHTVFYLVLPWDDFARIFSNYKIIGIVVETILQGAIAVVGCKIIEIIKKKIKKHNFSLKEH